MSSTTQISGVNDDYYVHYYINNKTPQSLNQRHLVFPRTGVRQLSAHSGRVLRSDRLVNRMYRELYIGKYLLYFQWYDIIILHNSVFHTLLFRSASQIAAHPVNVTIEQVNNTMNQSINAPETNT